MNGVERSRDQIREAQGSACLQEVSERSRRRGREWKAKDRFVVRYSFSLIQKEGKTNG